MDLYDYLFHYNKYTKYWNAFKRENKEKYFNGQLKEEEILKSKNIMHLINYIKTKNGKIK
jgi:hypothetical protein